MAFRLSLFLWKGGEVGVHRRYHIGSIRVTNITGDRVVGVDAAFVGTGHYTTKISLLDGYISTATMDLVWEFNPIPGVSC